MDAIRIARAEAAKWEIKAAIHKSTSGAAQVRYENRLLKDERLVQELRDRLG
jgi:hypothetical protein